MCVCTDHKLLTNVYKSLYILYMYRWGAGHGEGNHAMSGREPGVSASAPQGPVGGAGGELRPGPAGPGADRIKHLTQDVFSSN